VHEPIQRVEDLLRIAIEWEQRPPAPVWRALVHGDECTLVVNDFPAEPLYTVTWRDESLDVDDAPAGWHIPLAD